MVDVHNNPKVTVNGVQVPKEKSIGRQMLEVSQIIGDIFLLIVGIIFSIFESIYRLFVSLELKSVRGEIVLVTGTGHGIGRELALLYASEGATVVAWDINAQNNEKTVQEIKKRGYPKAYSYTCDVSNLENVLQIAEKVKNDVGDVTILINNAGIMPTHLFLEHTKEEFERIININVMAHFWTLKAFLPIMKKNNHGHIVALSSCAGFIGLVNLVPYCASKFAVRGLMEALYEELRQDKNCQIKTTTICPYMVDTGLCKNPKIRFESIMPLLKPASVAKAIMEAQRRNIMETSIPSYILTMNYYTRLLPWRAAKYMKDFFNSGVESDLL